VRHWGLFPYLGVVFDIAKSQQQKPAIQKLTKESFLKGSDEFKLEEVIAEFERKGIDEKYYKDPVSPSLITPFALAFIFSLISAFNFDVDVCSNIDITSVEAKARNSDKKSFLKGSDEFKLEEVIAEFERKGIDEKYYKDLGEEGKVKNKAVSQEYKLKKQKLAYVCRYSSAFLMTKSFNS
jgi:hypothetical protein